MQVNLSSLWNTLVIQFSFELTLLIAGFDIQYPEQKGLQPLSSFNVDETFEVVSFSFKYIGSTIPFSGKTT